MGVLRTAKPVIVGTAQAVNVRLPLWPVISLVVLLALMLVIVRGRK
jgi:hypothetical protein